MNSLRYSTHRRPAAFTKQQPRRHVAAIVVCASGSQHITQPQCVHQQQQQQQPDPALSLSRRQTVLGCIAAAAAAPLLPLSQQQAAQAADTAYQLAEAATITNNSSSGLQVYENSAQQYRMQVPVAWERKEKAGAQHSAGAGTCLLLLHSHLQVLSVGVLAVAHGQGWPHAGVNTPNTRHSCHCAAAAQVLTFCLRTLSSAPPLWV
jgi:hypothetical protein